MNQKPSFVSNEAIKRFYSFLNKTQRETYPETPINYHTMISDNIIDKLFEKYLKHKRGVKFLDVGCGQGLALKKFDQYDIEAIGITLNEEDYKVTKEKGYEVFLMDQSFLDFDELEFDFVWARHVLEHSPFPLFTLTEYSRVMKNDGLLYIEVPAPGTIFHHEKNPNHYSVFTFEVWISLFEKANFNILLKDKITLKFNEGVEDLYYYFLLQKESRLS